MGVDTLPKALHATAARMSDQVCRRTLCSLAATTITAAQLLAAALRLGPRIGADRETDVVLLPGLTTDTVLAYVLAALMTAASLVLRPAVALMNTSGCENVPVLARLLLGLMTAIALILQRLVGLMTPIVLVLGLFLVHPTDTLVRTHALVLGPLVVLVTDAIVRSRDRARPTGLKTETTLVLVLDLDLLA